MRRQRRTAERQVYEAERKNVVIPKNVGCGETNLWSMPPVCPEGFFCTALDPSQPRASQQCRQRAEPRSLHLQPCAGSIKPLLAAPSHDPGCTRYRPRTAWLAQCERLRRRTCLDRETAPLGRNGSKIRSSVCHLKADAIPRATSKW